MRLMFKAALLIASHTLIGAVAVVAAYHLFDPVPRMSLAQQSILNNYLDAYCRRIEPYYRTPERAMGAMVAMSRAVVAADIGPIVRMEYLKCMGRS